MYVPLLASRVCQPSVSRVRYSFFVGRLLSDVFGWDSGAKRCEIQSRPTAGAVTTNLRLRNSTRCVQVGRGLRKRTCKRTGPAALTRKCRPLPRPQPPSHVFSRSMLCQRRQSLAFWHSGDVTSTWKLRRAGSALHSPTGRAGKPLNLIHAMTVSPEYKTLGDPTGSWSLGQSRSLEHDT